MKRSNFLSLNMSDAIKGLFLAAITALISGVYQLISTGTLFTWENIKPMLLTVLATVLSYIIKNFLTNSQGEPLRTEKSELVLHMKARQPIVKIIMIGIILSGLSLTASAQLTFKGFFKPVKQGEFYSKLKGTANAALGVETLWLVRPAVNIGSMKYAKNSETKKLEVSNYVASGFGVGVQHYIDSDGSPYNNYGFNLLCLFNTVPLSDGTQNAGVSLAGTFGFMKVIDIGVGYDFDLKQVFALTGIKYNF